MADKNTPGFAAHWPALIALLVASGAAIFYVSPLNSSRPNGAAGKKVGSLGYENVEARLWQDPFEAAGEEDNDNVKASADNRSNQPADSHSITEIPGKDLFRQFEIALGIHKPVVFDGPSHRWVDLIDQIRNKLSHGSEITVLAVMVQAGPYSELGEQRMRLRVAVLDALALGQYIPSDAEHIGKVTVGWAWKSYTQPMEDQAEIASAMERDSGAGRLLIPYEWCQTAQNIGAPNRQEILVVWLNESAFSDLPLTRLGVLCAKLEAIKSSNLSIKIIGPRVSTVMRAMAEEASQGVSNTTVDALKNTRMFSATATAAEDLLLQHLATTATAGHKRLLTLSDLVEDRLKRDRSQPFLRRLTVTDRELCHDVIEELERRKDVHIMRQAGTDDNDPRYPLQSHVALVCEWDTFYARALVDTFEKQANQPKDRRAGWIYPRYYMRGIDGHIPALERREATNERDGPKTKERSERSVAYTERPEGMSGLDYLRRIADDLAELDESLKARAGGDEADGIRIIGVLGNDVYDKLLVMRALRDRLPGVQFFTIGMDARYTLASERPATHNLLVCSNFGLKLNDKFQKSMPPFRDSSQTAAFAGVQFALSSADEPMVDAVLGSLKTDRSGQLYTIGRTGAVNLSVVDAPIHPSRDKPLKWFEGHLWQISQTCFALAALLMTALLIGVRPEKIRWISSVTKGLPFLIFVTPMAVIVILLLHWCDDPLKGEPFAWADGVSIWPTEMFRLIVVALCANLLWRSRNIIKDNELVIEKEFRLLPLLKEHAVWTPDDEHPEPENAINALREPYYKDDPQKGPWYNALVRLFRRIPLSGWNVFGPADIAVIKRDWKERDYASDINTNLKVSRQPGKLKVFAQNLWWEYKRRSGRHRFVRIISMSAIYLAALWLLSNLLGTPRSPARSSYAQMWDGTILMAAVIASIILTFFVLDATYLNKRVIEYLMQEGTQWPHGVFDKPELAQLHLGLDLTEYLDVRFIALRTETVGDIIYYPFAIFFLMIVSRNSFFDNWDWPVGLIVALAGNLALAITGALMLRGVAERARRHALLKLNERRRGFLAASESKDSNRKAAVVAELIREVEEERRGAFSLLSEHPILAAIILPSGSIGIWVLLEYFAK